MPGLWGPPQEFLIHLVWGGDQDFAFLTISGETLMLLVWDHILRIAALDGNCHRKET